jgi:hypothetical protein
MIFRKLRSLLEAFAVKRHVHGFILVAVWLLVIEYSLFRYNDIYWVSIYPRSYWVSVVDDWQLCSICSPEPFL